MKKPSDPIQALLVEAVHREQAAHELYDRLSRRINNGEGAHTFRVLAEDEKDHRRLLEQWWRARYQAPFPFDEKSVRVPKIKIDDQAGAVDVLELALAAEKEAATLYESLAKSAGNAELATLCRDLAQQEWGHFQTIQSEIQAVTGNFSWLDIDYAKPHEE